MTTIVDITPRPPRRSALWLGLVAFAVFVVVVATWIVPAATNAGREQETQRVGMERNAYLATLCMLYGTDLGSDSELQTKAARGLCRCVEQVKNPSKDCNTLLRVWVVARDAERCETAGLREDAPNYCDCVEPVAQLVLRASGMDVARRRAYRVDQCRTLPDAPPLPPPPASAMTSDECPSGE